MELEDEIREFLIESSENLANFDRDIVQLEQTPGNIELVSSAFRTIHTIKGTCGFFGFDVLGSVAHVAENILSQVRERQRQLTPELISLVLEAVDEIKRLLETIEATGSEGEDTAQSLRARLEKAYEAGKFPSQPAGGTAAASVQTAAAQPVLEVGAAFVKALPPQAVKAVYVLPEPNPESQAAEEPGPSDDTAKDVGKEAQLAESTIRVDVGLLNRLMNLVGELVLARNQLLQDAPAHNSSLQQTSQRLNLITSELQEGVMKTRMQPIGVVWNKLPRVVRDLASKCGKRVQIEMDGAGTELDKTIIEAIKDPLTHIVRNSCDHGIETPEIRQAKGKNPEGLLLLRAYHEGGVVNIEISDDGAGIDPERVKAKAVEKGLIRQEQAAGMVARDAMHLIFLPGFSTAAQITSISGRGVGMDVVKTNIEKIGGSVELMNRMGGGTTIRIKIPLTLAIIPGLVVTLNHDGSAGAAGTRWRKEERFIVPQANLLELVRIEGAEIDRRIESVHGTPVFHHRGKLLPLVYLGRVLNRIESNEAGNVVNIIVLQAENRQLGLVVDRICDTQEIVVKPLGRQLKKLSCYVGATIMGDGRPALILDVSGLARLAGLGAHSRHVVPAPASTVAESQPRMMLLFQAGDYERLAVPLSLVDRLEEVSAAKIERSGGRLVLYYRGDILPLITLQETTPQNWREHESVQIIVFTNGVQRVGLMVRQVVDIVHEAVTIRRTSTVPGLLGSAVIGGKITDLLDLHFLIESSGQNWLDLSRNKPLEQHRLLLVDPSTAAREMVSDFLSISGYDVAQAATGEQAAAILQHKLPDLLLLSAGLRAKEKVELFDMVRMLKAVPIVELLDRAGQDSGHDLFHAKAVRSERVALLNTVAALLPMREEVLQ